MEFGFLLKHFVFFFIYLAKTCAEDLLDTIQLSDQNPAELNDFLSSVLANKNEFKLIREAVEKARFKPLFSDLSSDRDSVNENNEYKYLKHKYDPQEDLYVNHQKDMNFQERRNNPQRYDRHIFGHGRFKKYRNKLQNRFKRNSPKFNHRFRNIRISPLSETGVLIDKDEYELHQNQNKIKMRSINATTEKTTNVTKLVEARAQVPNNTTARTTIPTTPSTQTSAPEFYFTAEHDILGLKNDIENEFINETATTAKHMKHKNIKPSKKKYNTYTQNLKFPKIFTGDKNLNTFMRPNFDFGLKQHNQYKRSANKKHIQNIRDLEQENEDHTEDNIYMPVYSDVSTGNEQELLKSSNNFKPLEPYNLPILYGDASADIGNHYPAMLSSRIEMDGLNKEKFFINSNSKKHKIKLNQEKLHKADLKEKDDNKKFKFSSDKKDVKQKLKQNIIKAHKLDFLKNNKLKTIDKMQKELKEDNDELLERKYKENKAYNAKKAEIAKYAEQANKRPLLYSKTHRIHDNNGYVKIKPKPDADGYVTEEGSPGREKNIFLKARQKAEDRKSIEALNLNVVNNQRLSKKLFNQRLKNLNSEETESVESPLLDHYNLIQKNTQHLIKKPIQASHNFKVIEIDEGIDVTDSTTAYPDPQKQKLKARLEELSKQNYPTYEDVEKVEIKSDGSNGSIARLSTNDDKKRVTERSSNKKQNKLEDETAPTSAIEQAELGKTTQLGNTTTSPLDNQHTTQIFVLRDNHKEDDNFQVKEAKDMIHIKNDDADEMSKREDEEPEMIEDYDETEEIESGDAVNQMKKILDQDVRAQENVEEDNLDGISNILSDKSSVNEELDKIAKYENNYMFDDIKKRDSNDFFQKRRLQTINNIILNKWKRIENAENYKTRTLLSVDETINGKNTTLNRNVKDNNVTRTDVNKVVNKKSQITKEGNKINKINLVDLFGINKIEDFSQTNNNKYIESRDVVKEDDEEAEEDPFVSGKLVYNMKKHVKTENLEPFFNAKSADSPEGREQMDNLERLENDLRVAKLNAKSSPIIAIDKTVREPAFNEYEASDGNITYLPSIDHPKDPPLTFGMNKNIKYDKEADSKNDEIQEEDNKDTNSENYKEAQLESNAVTADNVSYVNSMSFSDTPKAKSEYDSNQLVSENTTSIQFNDAEDSEKENLENNIEKAPISEKESKKRPAEFIIHIIKTNLNDEDSDIFKFGDDLATFQHHGHNKAHNKIYPKNHNFKPEPKRENIHTDPSVTVREGPVIIETVLDPLSNKLEHLKVRDNSKANKFEALLDHFHGTPEAKFLAPLSLVEAKSKAVRSVNVKGKSPSVNKKFLLNSVESFKDIVESTEKDKKDIQKRDTNLLALEDPLLLPINENQIESIDREKRKLKYLDIVAGQSNKRNQRDMLDKYYTPKSSNQLHKIEERKAAAKKAKKKEKKKTKKGSSGKKISHLLKQPRLRKANRPPDDIAQIREILTGHMAQHIISTIYDKMKKNERLFNRFGKSISLDILDEEVKSVDAYRKEQAKIEIKRAQRMLHEVIESLNNIILAQVHHRLCQHPPLEVKEFLVRVTKKHLKSGLLAESYPLPRPKGALEHQPLDVENGAFLFPDKDEPQETSEQQMKKKIAMIQKLLDKYDRMSNKCKVQVEPVKEYLEDHLKLLTEVGDEPGAEKKYEEKLAEQNAGMNLRKSSFTSENIKPPDKNPSEDVKVNDLSSLKHPASLVEKDLEELGLDNAKGFVAPFDLDKFIEDAKRHANSSEEGETQTFSNLVKREIGSGKTRWDVSEKYKKLVATAAQIRKKRETEEKIGKLFGEKTKKSNSVTNLKDYSQIKFESPVVFSIDHVST